MGRSRGGLTSKIHAVVDTNGLPVRLALTTGEAHDNRLVLTLLSALKSGAMLLADRGFDADWIRAFVSEHGAWANIPPRRNRTEPICFSRHLYRARNLVERFFNKIKQCRRIATRYDKLAANYLAFIQLASIRLWLRANESTPLNENSWQFGSSVALTLSAVRLAPPNAEQFRHSHQVGERARGHFPHDMPAVNLDGNLAQPQFAGDLLVHQAGSDEAHHLAFALGQAIEACPHVR